MPAPYDYTIGQVPNPAQSFLQGIQTVDALRQREEQMAAAEQAKIIERQRQEAAAQLAEKIRSRTVTRGDYEAAMMANPKEYQAYKTAIDSLESEQKNNLFARGMPLYSALFKNTPESLKVAEQLIATDLQAAENRKDAVQVQQITMMRDLLKNNQVDALMGQVGAVMQSIDPERFEKGSSELRKMQEQPYTLRETIAKAGKAEGEAAKTAVEAKYLEREKVAELKKKAADLGLTQAQTSQSLASTSNLKEQGRLLRLDFDAALKGLPLPSKGGGQTTVSAATEDERKAAGWLAQATNAYTNMLKAMYTKEGKPTKAEAPGIMETMALEPLKGIVRSPERQQFVQATSSLSEALLRAATGAGVNKEEAAQKIAELTPVWSDDEATKKQKLDAIPMYLQSLQARAGRAAPKDYQVPTAPQQRNVVVSY